MNTSSSDSMYSNMTMFENKSECHLFPREESKCVALKYAKNISAAMSFTATLLMLVMILYFRQFKDFTQRMVINLCVASLFLGASFLVTTFEDSANPLCQFQGAGITFSVWACLLWTMGIVVALYLRVVYEYDLKQKEVLLTVVFWMIPVIIMAAPFLGSEVYAPTEVWCWIKNNVWWRFGIWYTWHIVSIFVFMFAMFRIVWTLHKKKRSHSTRDLSEQEQLSDDIKTLRRYPFAYTVVSIVAISSRTGNIFDYNSFALLIMFSILAPFLGSAVAFVFVIDKATIRLISRQEIRKAFEQWTSTKPEVKEYQINKSFNDDEAPKDGANVRTT